MGVTSSSSNLMTADSVIDGSVLERVTISSSVSSLSLSGTSSRVAVLTDVPGAKSMNKLETDEKPTTLSFPDPVTSIENTVVSAKVVPLPIVAVRVTEVTPSPSPISDGSAARRILPGASSLSSRTTVADSSTSALVLLIVIVSLTSSSESLIGVKVNVTTPLDAPCGIVRSKSGTGKKSTAEAVPEPATVSGIV